MKATIVRMKDFAIFKSRGYILKYYRMYRIIQLVFTKLARLTRDPVFCCVMELPPDHSLNVVNTVNIAFRRRRKTVSTIIMVFITRKDVIRNELESRYSSRTSDCVLFNILRYEVAILKRNTRQRIGYVRI
jgi:hypothetical protein